MSLGWEKINYIVYVNSLFPFDTLVLAILYYLSAHVLKASACIFFCEKCSRLAARSCHPIRISCAKATVPSILDHNKDADDLARNKEYLGEDRTLEEARGSPWDSNVPRIQCSAGPEGSGHRPILARADEYCCHICKQALWQSCIWNFD